MQNSSPTFGDAVTRKVAWRLVPFLCVLFFFSFLDRVNVGFAALTMNEDLGFSPAVYGIGAGIFFLGYALFEVPSNVILARVGARRWIARIMVTWGLLAAGTAFVTGPTSFYVVRLLLGIAEAGFFPGMIYYLSCWFPAALRARIVAAFLIAVPLSSAVGAPLSTLLLGFEGLGLKGWQWLFLLQGLPAAMLGLVVLRVLPDRPSDARWLAPDEQRWLTRELDGERDAIQQQHHASVREALTSPRIWAFGLAYFGILVGLYAFGFWLPQILRSLGSLSNVEVGLFAVIPYAIAAITMYAWGLHSDRTGERRWHVAAPALLGAAGLLASGLLEQVPLAGFIALIFSAIGIYGALPAFWTLPAAMLTGTAAAGGIALVNSIGNLGGFVGPTLIGAIKTSTGSYAASFAVLAGALALSALIVLSVGRSRVRKTATPVVAIALLIFAAGAVVAPAPAAAAAADEGAARAADQCAQLAQQSFAQVSIVSAEAVVDGRLSIAGAAPMTDLPKFCRVVGIASPKPASQIGFEVWLPLERWNGRFVQAGNGGLAGIIFYPILTQMIRRGYVTASTDMGHRASPVDGSWAIGHPQRIEDFGVLAVPATRAIALELAQRLYARPAERSYFVGCSQGGREAIMAAQRRPQDYDGIVAGAPANDWVSLLAGFVWNAQAVHANPASFIPAAKLARVQAAALEACDADDGVQDGVVSRPRACRFSPGSLQCAAGSGELSEARDQCLTAAQVDALEKVYRGLRDPASGEQISPGYAMSGEHEAPPVGGGLRGYVFGEQPGLSLNILFATGFFGGLVYGDPQWDWRKFDVSRDLPWARQRVGALLDGTDTDLRAFRDRGGKLIQYHGWLDGSVPPEASIRYHEGVSRRMGGARRTQSFYRLFMAPGVLHCGFGPGANAFGNMGPEAPLDAEHDVLLALERWVEQGQAPARIVATKYVDDDVARGILRQRPLCPYPLEARWDRRGDPDKAASFRCATAR